MIATLSALLAMLAQAAPVATAPRGWIITLEIIVAVLCLLLILLIAVSPSQGEGLASAFSGVGSDSFFGTRAQSKLNWFTTGLAVTVILLVVAINLLNAGTPGKTVAMYLGALAAALVILATWLVKRKSGP
jgi:protein translocase SecG subunit